MITAIIPTRDRKEELGCLLDSLRPLASEGLEIIVVDDGSGDGTETWLEQHHPAARTLRNPRPLGAARARNQAAAVARGELLWFLDSDSLVPPGCRILTAGPALLASAHDVGAVGGEIYRLPDGDLEWRQKALLSNGETRTISHRGGYGGAITVDYLPTCNLMMRADLFRRVGGFDPGYFYLMEDTDLCHRLGRLGLRCLASDDTAVEHRLVLRGRPGDLFLSHRNRIRFALLNFPGWKAAALPLLDLSQLASPYKLGALLRGRISADKHLSPAARSLGRRRTTLPLKVALAGAEYLSSLALGYAWTMARLPGWARLRARARRDFLCAGDGMD